MPERDMAQQENGSPASDQLFVKTIQIDALPSKVWEALTTPESMKKWMSETEIDILTDWKVGTPFLIRGKLHGIKFENKGTVLAFEKKSLLRYSHFSSISRLPDKPENYSIFEFALLPIEHQTSLTFKASIFPTEIIYKHLAFYWNVTLEILKRMIEQPGQFRSM
jgi:uncharacterized protein YndB with AHSA1/START domain